MDPARLLRLREEERYRFLRELGRLPVGLAVLAVPVVLVNLVSRPTPGLDTRVTSTAVGTGPTSDIS